MLPLLCDSQLGGEGAEGESGAGMKGRGGAGECGRKDSDEGTE